MAFDCSRAFFSRIQASQSACADWRNAFTCSGFNVLTVNSRRMPHVVLDQQHSDAAPCDLADDVRQAIAFSGRQPGGRLVEQHQPGFRREATGNFKQPSLSERKGADIGIAPFAQADEVNQRVGTHGGFTLCLCRAACSREHLPERAGQAGVHSHHHILAHRHAGKRLVVLESAHDAACRHRMGRQAVQPKFLSYPVAGRSGCEKFDGISAG